MIAKLTHANTKREILVAVPLIYSSYFSDASKCTHVLSAGGAILPVIEEPGVVMDFVNKYWEAANGDRTKRG